MARNSFLVVACMTLNWSSLSLMDPGNGPLPSLGPMGDPHMAAVAGCWVKVELKVESATALPLL